VATGQGKIFKELMAFNGYTRYIATGLLLMQPLWGAEFHGQVKFGGLPVPGATIIATQADKTQSAVSDQLGVYSFADLPDGNWTLSVEMPGFSPVKQDVTTGTSLPGPSFDLKMLPLDQMQTVAAPPVVVGPASATQTSSADPAPAAPPPAPSAVPAGKPSSATAKVAAAAAAKPATAFQRTDLQGAANAPAAPAAPEPAPEVTSELSQRAADGFLVNGSSVNGASSPFAQSNAFGNSRKGVRSLYTSAIQVVMDSSVLDARPYSLTGQNTERPGFNHAVGTLSFGGPIKIPHLINRNGPNFTVNYTWFRNRNPSITTNTMPNALERGGDFSQQLNSLGKPVQIFDPTNGQQFAGNQIPVSRISPQATALLAFYPLPNFASAAGYNYQAPLIANAHQDAFNARLQKSFKRKNFMAGGLSMQSNRNDTSNVYNFLDLTHSLGINANVSYRRTYTARFFGTFGYTFSRNSNETFPFFANRANVSGIAGITGNNQDPLNWGPPSLSFGSSLISGLSDQNSRITHNQTHAFSYDSSWSHNRHNITFGGDYRRQQFNTIAQNNPRGNFTFNGSSTMQVVGGVPVVGTGYDFAGFMLGIPDTSAIAFGNADKYLRSTQSDLYFTDDWRISPGFTLNAGLRWEYGSPITEKYGRLVNLDIGPGFGAIAPVVAYNPVGPITGNSYPDSLVNPDKGGLQPRVAFSWRPFPASSMVVRGGYGVYYNTSAYQQFAQNMVQQSPLSKSLSVANTPENPLTLANGFYAPPNVVTNTFALDPHFQVGYSQNWQLSVQRDLPAALMMTATYAGVKGTRAIQAFLPNTYPSGMTNPCPACVSGYTYLTSNGNSTREAGTIQVRRRLHSGFTATVTYTYSKSIDDAAALGGGNNGGSVLAQDWLHLNNDRSRSSFDQRHLANFQMQYTSGMGVGGGTLLSGWRGRMIKDWTFVTNINLGSGLPLTPVYGAAAVKGTGATGSIRPDYTGADVYAAPNGLYLNPAAYTQPVSGQWGTAGRNSITGPGQFSINASMSRAFRINDRVTVNLTINASNPINHVTFQNWVTTTTSSQFGLPASPNSMRNMSTTFRVTF
jgi:hypothetical protein